MQGPTQEFIDGVAHQSISWDPDLRTAVVGHEGLLSEVQRVLNGLMGKMGSSIGPREPSTVPLLREPFLSRKPGPDSSIPAPCLIDWCTKLWIIPRVRYLHAINDTRLKLKLTMQ